MFISNEKVYLNFCIPLKIYLKICSLVVIITFLLMLYIVYLNEVPILKIDENFNESSNKQIEVKTILYWTRMFDDRTFYLGSGDIFKNCEVSACQATWNREFMNIQDFDALLFHGIQIKPFDLPSIRSSKQKYIFVDLETPRIWPLTSSCSLNKFYNWSMTYRRDSTIPRTYGYIFNSVTNDVVYPLWFATNSKANHVQYENHPNSPGDSNDFKDKVKTAAWFVSHCNSVGLRDDYVAELRKYIDIDIYGKCGSFSCPSGDDKCYEMLESRYYFYLSFENSLCQDYVTEKLYKVMSYNIVPIVYGGANYTEFAPPGSYINVIDFENPRLLAKYLRYLMNNLEEYAKFFWWKKYFSVSLNHHVSICKMCKLLHDEKSLTESSILNLTKWWNEGQCQNSVDFLKKITRH